MRYNRYAQKAANKSRGDEKRMTVEERAEYKRRQKEFNDAQYRASVGLPPKVDKS